MSISRQTSHILPRHTTSFVGRDKDIADIVALIDNPDCHLLTLHGPGGVGKTRLAIEVAKQISAEFDNGVCFVQLQPLHSTAELLPAIINQLNITLHHPENAYQQLLGYLADKELLLVLDNYEHLLESAHLVAGMASVSAGVKVLTTSREVLNLREEWLWEVHGLRYPAQNETDERQAYSAVRLFIERARQIQPGFSSADNTAAIVSICQQVQGMPLALELAATWITTLSCEAIDREIQKDIDFLASRARNIEERHRSIRVIFNHSWRLLFEEERDSFANLAIFRGGFARDAAEAVTGVSLVTLASLVEKSLVQRGASGRYNIHELLRQYGEEHLADTDVLAVLKDRHAVYFAGLLAQYESDLQGDRQLDALNTIEADFDNFRTAWVYLLEQRDGYHIDQMIGSLSMYCWVRGRLVEHKGLFVMARDALTPAPGEDAHPAWGRVLVRTPGYGLPEIEQALDLARPNENAAEVAFCLQQRGIYHCQRRSFAQALDDLHNSMTIHRQLENTPGMAALYADLVYTNVTIGDWATAQTHLDEGDRLVQEIGNPSLIHAFLFLAGWVACFQGDYERSEGLLRQALAIADAANFRLLAADDRGSLGFLAFLRGDLQQAREFIVDDLATVRRIEAPGVEGFATLAMAHIACVEEDYEHARLLADRALTLVKPHPARERFIARLQAMADCGLGDYTQARRHIYSVLAEETCQGVWLWTMPMVAIVQAQAGDHEGAAELLGLAFTHPASATGWLARWPLIARVRQNLEATLGSTRVADAWQKGAQLDLNIVVEQMLVETDASARQPLTEPLTKRELEVLYLVAEGRSNREIADTLTIVEGTVRTHVYNLCQKLGTHNRTAAVARARILRII